MFCLDTEGNLRRKASLEEFDYQRHVHICTFQPFLLASAPKELQSEYRRVERLQAARVAKPDSGIVSLTEAAASTMAQLPIPKDLLPQSTSAERIPPIAPASTTIPLPGSAQLIAANYVNSRPTPVASVTHYNIAIPSGKNEIINMSELNAFQNNNVDSDNGSNSVKLSKDFTPIHITNASQRLHDHNTEKQQQILLNEQMAHKAYQLELQQYLQNQNHLNNLLNNHMDKYQHPPVTVQQKYAQNSYSSAFQLKYQQQYNGNKSNIVEISSTLTN